MLVNEKQHKLKIKSSLNRTLTQISTGFIINCDEVNITPNSIKLLKPGYRRSLTYTYSRIHNLIIEYCNSIIQFITKNPLKERSLKRNSRLSQILEEAIPIRKSIKRDDRYRRYLDYLEFIE